MGVDVVEHHQKGLFANQFQARIDEKVKEQGQVDAGLHMAQFGFHHPKRLEPVLGLEFVQSAAIEDGQPLGQFVEGVQPVLIGTIPGTPGVVGVGHATGQVAVTQFGRLVMFPHPLLDQRDDVNEGVSFALLHGRVDDPQWLDLGISLDQIQHAEQKRCLATPARPGDQNRVVMMGRTHRTWFAELLQKGFDLAKALLHVTKKGFHGIPLDDLPLVERLGIPGMGQINDNFRFCAHAARLLETLENVMVIKILRMISFLGLSVKSYWQKRGPYANARSRLGFGNIF
ncbi:MAG: hypothetical protein HQL96_05140 [Magnetococcales bacterium]|nr:hypothetical protein [Magnetococcales bacterium]